MKAILNVKVIPNAKKSEIVELLADGTVKIRIKAPALEGRANRELSHFLSQMLEIKPELITIQIGEKTSRKILLIEKVEKEYVDRILKANQHK